MDNKFKLPDGIEEVKSTNPRDLIVMSIPKMGKSVILGDLTTKKNAIVFNLEKGGYEYIPARKISIHDSNETDFITAYNNYIGYRNQLLENKGKYEYLIIDGLSDLDAMTELGGTLLYMGSRLGKSFNRTKLGEKIQYGDPEWKSVLSLAEFAGYKYTRSWFLQQIEIFKQIAPYRIYAAHVADRYIKVDEKETVVGSEINLTGKIKLIFTKEITALGRLIADRNERYITFDVQNDSILAGSRAPHLAGKIKISKKEDDGTITTFWENIYK